MYIGNLLEKELRIMIVKMTQDLGKIRENLMAYISSHKLTSLW